jgi:hypothetical protein
MYRDDRHSLAARNQALERELAARPTAEDYEAIRAELDKLRRKQLLAQEQQGTQDPSDSFSSGSHLRESGNPTISAFYLGMVVMVCFGLVGLAILLGAVQVFVLGG